MNDLRNDVSVFHTFQAALESQTKPSERKLSVLRLQTTGETLAVMLEQSPPCALVPQLIGTLQHWCGADRDAHLCNLQLQPFCTPFQPPHGLPDWGGRGGGGGGGVLMGKMVVYILLPSLCHPASPQYIWATHCSHSLT